MFVVRLLLAGFGIGKKVKCGRFTVMCENRLVCERI